MCTVEELVEEFVLACIVEINILRGSHAEEGGNNVFLDTEVTRAGGGLLVGVAQLQLNHVLFNRSLTMVWTWLIILQDPVARRVTANQANKISMKVRGKSWNAEGVI